MNNRFRYKPEGSLRKGRQIIGIIKCGDCNLWIKESDPVGLLNSRFEDGMIISYCPLCLGQIYRINITEEKFLADHPDMKDWKFPYGTYYSRNIIAQLKRQATFR